MGPICSQLNPEDYYPFDYTNIYSEVGQAYLSKINSTRPNAWKNGRGGWQLMRLHEWLHQNREQFHDHIFAHSSLLSSQKAVTWQRVGCVFPGQTFRVSDWSFEYMEDNAQSVSNKSFKQAMLQLQKHPVILENICQDREIDSSGMYRFFFCLRGDCETEVVIDDFIPVNKSGKYFFDQPKPSTGVWMVLLERALAKVFRSYQNLSKLSRHQILSQLSGFPCLDLYEPEQLKFHMDIKIEGKNCKYLKVNFTSGFKLALCLWYPIDLKSTTVEPENMLIVELIDVGNTSIKVPLKKRISGGKNMIVFLSQSQGFVDVHNKQAVIHFYNRSAKQMSCNFVVQTNSNINLRLITEADQVAECRGIKNQMILSEYNKIHLILRPLLVTSRLKLRFAWMEHRGIFCIKNLSQANQKFRLRILDDYESVIHFEDTLQNEKQGEVGPNSHLFFLLNRQLNQEYGVFYQLSPAS